jgi:hypothetical protein
VAVRAELDREDAGGKTVLVEPYDGVWPEQAELTLYVDSPVRQKDTGSALARPCRLTFTGSGT